jgi:hypothetical protein
MAWARVDDAWWSHPKVMGLSLAARGLWISALSWSCHQRKPIVPRSFLAMVGGSEDIAAELVGAGLWEPSADGWAICSWAEYQDRSLSEKRAEAGRKGGQRKQTASKPEANAQANGCLDEANGQAGPSHPIPTQPIPSSSSSSVLPVDSVLDSVATARLAAAKRTGAVRNPKAWIRAVRADLAGDAEVLAQAAYLCERFDDDPWRIAEVIEGTRPSTGLTKRRHPDGDADGVVADPEAVSA